MPRYQSDRAFLCGEKAFHPCVVVTASRAAHALNCGHRDYPKVCVNFQCGASILHHSGGLHKLWDSLFLQDCTNLVHLTLTCSASDFEPISALSQLQMLSVQSPNLTNLDFLEQLNLTALLCPHDENLADIAGLQDMASLELLSLFYCSDIEDFSALSSLSGLNSLYLSGTKFADLTQIASLSDLSILSIQSCPVDFSDFASANYMLTQLQCDADAETTAWLLELFPDCEFP